MRDLVLFSGGAVKALGPYRFGGHGILFTTEKDPDLENDYFTDKSEFWLEDRIAVPVLYAHARDKAIGKQRLGTAKWRKDAGEGIWFEAQMELRNDYVEKIMELIRKGKLGFSTAALGHLVERVEGKLANWLKQWPVYEISLTPSPAEPRTLATELKSWRPVSLARMDQASTRASNLSPWDRERERFRQSMLRAIADDPKSFTAEQKRDAGYVDEWFSEQELAANRERWEQMKRTHERRMGSLCA